MVELENRNIERSVRRESTRQRVWDYLNMMGFYLLYFTIYIAPLLPMNVVFGLVVLAVLIEVVMLVIRIAIVLFVLRNCIMHY